MVRSGFNGFVDYLFIVNALFSARNGGIRFEYGSRPFENQFFEHPRSRNEPGKTVRGLPGTQNHGRSSRNNLKLLLGPETDKKLNNKNKYNENPEIPEIPLPCYT